MKAFKQLCETATKGPFYVGSDPAHDCPAHEDSGLALVDTGRGDDWPIVRLSEWNDAVLTALSRNYVERLVESLIRRTSTCAGCEQCRADWALLAEIEEAAKGATFMRDKDTVLRLTEPDGYYNVDFSVSFVDENIEVEGYGFCLKIPLDWVRDGLTRRDNEAL